MPDAPRPMFELAITDHLEGPRDIPSADIYRQVIELVQLADSLGVQYAWFAEHHAHAHQGHLPTPILLALHVAALTKKIQLGSAVVCLNLHQPLDIAEQIAVADILTNGRIAPGFGSGTINHGDKNAIPFIQFRVSPLIDTAIASPGFVPPMSHRPPALDASAAAFA